MRVFSGLTRISHLLLLPSICALGISACVGGSGRNQGMGAQLSTYVVTNLVSDGAIPAAHVDTRLMNPWGIAFEPTGPVWVSDNHTQVSTLYDGTGAPQALVVGMPTGVSGNADPTGIVLNTTSDFVLTSGAAPGPAMFIFATLGGTLAGWSPNDGTNAVTVFDGGASGSVYTGLAVANNGGANFLYAADFRNNKIDVFDHTFTKVISSGGFADPNLPSGYAPYNIQNIGGMLYVAYDQQNPTTGRVAVGAGLGAVDVYDPAGHLLKRLATGGALNAPWGFVMAPASFGPFGNDLLIGNFGDGTINVYNPSSGSFLGSLKNDSGTPIAYPGLWGLAFGNGFASQPGNTLFFAAGINNEADGVYGRIDVAVSTSNSAGSPGY